MGDPQRGLYNKFTVTRTDGQDLDHDPFARAAIEAYESEPGAKHDGCYYFVLANACEAEYPALAADLRVHRGQEEGRMSEMEPGRDASGGLKCRVPGCRAVIRAMTGLQEIQKLKAHVRRAHRVELDLGEALDMRARWEADHA